MQSEFSWVTVQVTMYANRRREPGAMGELQRCFKLPPEDPEAIDYMLVPADAGVGVESLRCYKYKLRVVGPRHLLKGSTSTNTGSFPITELRDKKLVAAPQQFSSRDRVDSLLKKYDVKPAMIFEEENPLLLRTRAMAGEALAVLSDEYSDIGGAQPAYPPLAHGNDNEQYVVEMHLSRREGLNHGVHAAFSHVVDHLAQQETTGQRPAALD